MRQTASVASDLTGQSVQTVNSELLSIVWELTQVFPIAACIVGLYVASNVSFGTLTESQRVTDFLATTLGTTDEISKYRLVFALAYLVWGGISWCLMFVGLGVFWFGVTGTWPLPDTILSPIAALLPNAADHSTDALLTETFYILDTTFEAVPLFEARTLSLGSLTIIFAPIGFVCAGMVTYLLVTPSTIARNYIKGDSVSIVERTFPPVRVTPSSGPVEPIRLFGHTFCLFCSVE